MEHRDNTVGFFWWSGATGFAECVGPWGAEETSYEPASVVIAKGRSKRS